jgi:WD40 repeat protein
MPILATFALSIHGTVRMWDLRTGQQRHVSQGHQSGVSALCSLTADGQPLHLRVRSLTGAARFLELGQFSTEGSWAL